MPGPWARSASSPGRPRGVGVEPHATGVWSRATSVNGVPSHGHVEKSYRLDPRPVRLFALAECAVSGWRGARSRSRQGGRDDQRRPLIAARARLAETVGVGVGAVAPALADRVARAGE